jgi:hypothetical protein
MIAANRVTAYEEVRAMRKIIGAALFVSGITYLVGTATAAELTGAEVKQLLSGKTVYLELTATSSGGAGQGVIYFAADGTALYRTAKGLMWHGMWAVKDNTACTDWKEFPNNPCSKYDKQGDAIMQLNAVTNQPRAKVIKTVDGNAEKLVP